MLFIAALLGAVEVGLRVAGKGRRATSIDRLHEYSEVYGWTLRRSFTLEADGRVITINDAGYRGRELPRRKGARKRMVVLGDSITFGIDVSDGDPYPALIDAGRDDLEVANLAVSGYGPDQELMRLEREGLPLKPDIVVLGACLSNDMADAALDTFLYDERHPKPFFAVDDGRLVLHDGHLRLSPAARLVLFLRDHWRLYNVLLPPPPRDDGRRHWLGRRKRAMKTPGLPERVALLWRRAADVSRDAGAAFLVLALPEAGDDPAPSTWLDHVLRSPRLGDVPVVDMAKRFRSKGFESRHLMLDAVGHLSPAGHRVTADVLEEVLVKRGLLPPRRRLATGTRPDTHRTP